MSRYVVLVWSEEHAEKYSVTNHLAKSNFDYFNIYFNKMLRFNLKKLSFHMNILMVNLLSQLEKLPVKPIVL